MVFVLFLEDEGCGMVANVERLALAMILEASTRERCVRCDMIFCAGVVTMIIMMI